MTYDEALDWLISYTNIIRHKEILNKIRPTEEQLQKCIQTAVLRGMQKERAEEAVAAVRKHWNDLDLSSGTR